MTATRVFGIAILSALAFHGDVCAQHRLITQGNGKLAIVNAAGTVEWRLAWGPIHDIHVQPTGRAMLQQGAARVVEMDLRSQKIVWSYDSATANGNRGKSVEVHSFVPLPDGRIAIAESGPARIIEVDRAGIIHREIRLKVDRPHPHTDTRLMRRLTNGNYLVCHEGDGVVREYSKPTGDVAWEYPVPMFGKKSLPGHGPEAFGNKVFAALRLPNGNTLIATGNGHSVLEVTPDKRIVWELHQNDLPGITLAWVTTLEVLPNGNFVIGNCHAGPGNPLLIELDPKTKAVVWRFDQFEKFGNSVSNSQILDAEGLR